VIPKWTDYRKLADNRPISALTRTQKRFRFARVVFASYNFVFHSEFMLINVSGTQAVCSLGWAHKGSLWVYRIDHAAPQVLKLSDAKYLTVKAGNKNFFSVVHHWDGDKLEISAHNHAEPSRRLSSILLQRSGLLGAKTESKVIGDSSAWMELPRAYVAFAFDDFHLFLVRPDGSISSQTFPWYTNTEYDKGYQGIVAVEELPNSHALIVSVQRDSNPVLYDPDSGTAIRKLTLAGRGGNPNLKLRATAGEYWANDYDTIVKLDATTLNVIACRRLQGSEQSAVQFIGEFSLCRSDTLCLVTRPFSGDVIGLDCATMAQTHRATLGKQPLLAGLLGDDRVVALDWKTGEFLAGTLEKT